MGNMHNFFMLFSIVILQTFKMRRENMPEPLGIVFFGLLRRPWQCAAISY